jgi:hypothetical protein
MQWIQDPNHSKNTYTLNNKRREASRHSRNKQKEYLKVKISELETESNVKNIRVLYRGIKDFKKLRTNRVYDKKGHLVTDSHSIVFKWRNHFSQVLNIHGVNDVRQT